MLPGPNDLRWTRVLETNTDLSAATLATKFVITRLRRELKNNPSERDAKVAELRAFFERNRFAERDLPLL